MHVRPLRRPAPGSAPSPLHRRRTETPGGAGGSPSPTHEAADEFSPIVPILEAENKGLRQLLAEAQASRDALRRELDELRRERDHWQNLAKSAEGAKAAPRSWFCGRATAV